MPTIKKTAQKIAAKVTKPLKKDSKKDLGTLHDLFLVQMKDLYDTEQQIIKALPKVIKNATSPDLKGLLEHHLKETHEHAERLERIYASMDMNPKRQTSQGMKGLIDDAKEVFDLDSEPELLDAAIVANSEHIEHHEIAGYKATIEWAQLLGMTEAVELMKKSLEQEEKMNDKLASLAKTDINKKAAQK